MSVRVNLIWTAPLTKESYSQVLYAKIVQPDGQRRLVSERITTDRGTLHPLVVEKGSQVEWYIETTVKGWKPTQSDTHSFVAEAGAFVSPAATNLTVDLVNAKNDAGHLSGHLTAPVKPPVTPPVSTVPPAPTPAADTTPPTPPVEVDPVDGTATAEESSSTPESTGVESQTVTQKRGRNRGGIGLV